MGLTSLEGGLLHELAPPSAVLRQGSPFGEGRWEVEVGQVALKRPGEKMACDVRWRKNSVCAVGKKWCEAKLLTCDVRKCVCALRDVNFDVETHVLVGKVAACYCGVSEDKSVLCC